MATITTRELIEIEVSLEDVLEEDYADNFEGVLEDVCEHFGMEIGNIVPGNSPEDIAKRLENALNEALYLEPPARAHVYKQLGGLRPDSLKTG